MAAQEENLEVLNDETPPVIWSKMVFFLKIHPAVESKMTFFLEIHPVVESKMTFWLKIHPVVESKIMFCSLAILGIELD